VFRKENGFVGVWRLDEEGNTKRCNPPALGTKATMISASATKVGLPRMVI